MKEGTVCLCLATSLGGKNDRGEEAIRGGEREREREESETRPSSLFRAQRELRTRRERERERERERNRKFGPLDNNVCVSAAAATEAAASFARV